jgi:hypothetical protein
MKRKAKSQPLRNQFFVWITIEVFTFESNILSDATSMTVHESVSLFGHDDDVIQATKRRLFAM